MKRILMLSTMMLAGCSTMPAFTGGGSSSDRQLQPDSSLVAFPIPQSSISKCIRGSIDEVIAGHTATVIWYQSANGNGLTNVRLPMSHPVRIRVSAEAFCYDYFDVNR